MIESEHISDDGVRYLSCGIAAGKQRVEDLSTERDEIEKLVHLCNCLNVPAEELDAIAEDFLARFS